jgi:hypothetical protein
METTEKGRRINPRRFDDLVEQIAVAGESHVIVDTGSSSFVALVHYLVSNDVPAVLSQTGHELVGSGKDSSKLRRSTSVIATSFCLWSLCGGNKAGLNYLIISELSEAEMEKLEGPLRERSNPSGRGRMCALCGIKVPSIAFICRRAYKSESELFDRFPAP